MNNSISPLVSIIVPCYGVEHYLDRCLESITNQTIKDIEIILIDDGSPDNVPTMCDNWLKKDERIRVIHKENAGLGYARNTGLEIATGEFVAFVDSDDYVDVKMFANLYSEARFSNADVVFCGFKIEQETGIWRERSEFNNKIEYDSRILIDNFMLDMIASEPKVKVERKYWMSVWHGIYKRQVIEDNKIRFYSERDVVSEDIPFQCQFLLNSSKLIYIPNCYYYYCLNDTSLTNTFKIEKFYRFKTLHTLLCEITKDIPDALQRVDRLYIGYVRSLMIQMYGFRHLNYDSYIEIVLSDPIWEKLKMRYLVHYLPFYQRLFYSSLLSKKKYLLIVLCKLSVFLKRILNKRE